MKISFVLDTFGGGGKERRCLQLIQGLNKKGIADIQVIIIDGRVDYPDLFQTSSQVTILDKNGKRLGNIGTIRRIKQLIDTYDPDIVQAWGLMSNLFVSVIKPFRRFKLISAYVADCVRPQSKIAKLCNLSGNVMADKIIGNSYEGLKAYGVPERKRVCIYNGFNKNRLVKLSDADRKALREDIGHTRKYMVAMVARVTRNKDYTAYLNLARTVCSRRDDVDFFAIGGGQLYPKFKSLAEEEFGGCVKFIGRRDDVDKLFELTTISVLLSELDFGEGVSNSILESMAHGVPVMATNRGGTPEIIEDGYNGFLIDDNDVNYTADKICQLLDEPQLLERMGRNALRTCETKFNLDAKTEEYLDCYKNLLI